MNSYRIEGDTAILTLTRGQETIIDLDDLAKALRYRWKAVYVKKYDRYYAASSTLATKGGSGSLHRYLLDAPPDRDVDHEDHDTLNNRRSNLRLVTTSQNCQNRQGANSTSRTGVRGVITHPKGYYHVRVTLNYQRFEGGNFPLTPEGLAAAEQAAIALRQRLFTHSKEHARG